MPIDHYLIKQIAEQLSPIGNKATCTQYAWWLLQAVTEKTGSDLIKQQRVALSTEQKQQLEHWITELVVQHKPLAYILGSVPFCDVTIMVKPPILIPRPETEEWVAHLITQLQKAHLTSLAILEIGTGSGCIALAIGKALSNCTITATDVNPAAVELAQKNAQTNLVDNVSFVHSDLFENLGSTKFDMIISNPPYIALKEKIELSRSVLEWEDPTALFASDDGDALLKKIIATAPVHLTDNQRLEQKGIPQLILEVGYTQAARITAYMQQHNYRSVMVAKDSFGNDRVVTGNYHV